MRWPRANLEEKQEPRAATSASAERRAEGMWHDVTRKDLTEAAIEKRTFGKRSPGAIARKPQSRRKHTFALSIGHGREALRYVVKVHGTGGVHGLTFVNLTTR